MAAHLIDALVCSLDSVSDLVAALDLEFRFIAFNQAYASEFEQIFGSRITTGMSLLDALAHLPDEQASARALWGRALAGEEFTVVRAFGDRQRTRDEYEMIYRGVRDQQGRLVGAIHVVRHAAARWRAEQVLRENEDRYRSLTEAMPQHVWHTDAAGRVLYANTPWCAYTGQTAEEALRSMFTAVHPDDQPRMWKAWSDALADVRPYSVEFRIRRHDGAYRWFLSRGAPVRDAAGVLRGWVGTNTDIDDHKRTEERAVLLHRITAALAGALTARDVAAAVVAHAIEGLAAAAGAVGMLDPDGAALTVLAEQGFPAELLSGITHVPLSAALPLTDAVRAGRTLFLTAAECQARYPDLGPAQDWLGSCAALPLPLGDRVLGGLVLGFAADYAFAEGERAFLSTLAIQCAQALERAALYESEHTARAAAEAALHQRDEFFTIAAHELKTPLTSLLGNAELLLRWRNHATEEDMRATRAVRMIAQQVARLDQLITGMLDVNRLQTGELTIYLAPCDLCQVAERSISPLRSGLLNHTLTLACATPALPVLGDELRLQQAFRYLIQNAIKYSPDGGTIHVYMERHGEDAVFRVVDRGIGIPAEAQTRVFDRFYRAPNVSVAAGFSGLGIGLYLVREIVTRHGGVVGVTSVEGEGSTFTVRIPLLHQDAERANDSATEQVARAARE